MLDVITILGVNAAIQHANRKLYLFDKEVLCVALDGICTFQDGSDVMLDHEHLRDLKLQVQGRAPTFHAPKPEKTRDTQFAGFAKALFDELPDVPNDPLDTRAYDAWSDVCENILAQRAYDLACHVFGNTSSFMVERLETCKSVGLIPDMAKLPEVPK